MYPNLKIIPKGRYVCSYVLVYANELRYMKVMGETYCKKCNNKVE